jgi:hypothetical protein
VRTIYVNPKIIAQATSKRLKLWLSLIPLSPVFIIVFLDQDPEGFLKYTGLTYWQAFAIAMTFALAGIFYARKVWTCPVCNKYLGSDILTKFCPHCATYIAIPQSASPIDTQDERLYRGAANVSAEEFAAMEADEKQKGLIKRYRMQIIVSVALTVLFAGIAILSEVNARPFSFDMVKTIVLYVGGTFSYCWCAIFLFYFDEWVLARYNNRFTRILMGIYNVDIIKVAFALLGGFLLLFMTVGIFGLWVFFTTRSNLRLLTNTQPVRQVA